MIGHINHTKLKKYLKVLMENNMIKYDPQARIFRTSDKGIDFLKVHIEFEEAFHGIITVIRQVRETIRGNKTYATEHNSCR